MGNLIFGIAEYKHGFSIACRIKELEGQDFAFLDEWLTWKET